MQLLKNKIVFVIIAYVCCFILLIVDIVQHVKISNHSRDIELLKDQVALQYLCTNNVWHSDGMSLYPLINGLYEDLNTYNSNALFEWDERIPSLRNSNQWNSVIEAYKGVSEFGLPAENYANDGFITVSRYVDTIKKKDSIQRKKYDMQLAARYLDNKSIWRKKDLSEFVCTKGLWEPLASIELKNYQHYYSQSFDLKSVKSLATIDSLCTSILKNDRHDYYRLKDRIRSANIIYDDMLNIEQYIVALKDYNSYLLNPYTDERLKKNIHLMY